MSAAGDRTRWLSRAVAVERVSLVWMLAEGVASVAAGIAAGSLSLEAFGVDSLIEMATAWVVLWRLGIEVRSVPGRGMIASSPEGRRPSPDMKERVEAAERLASRVVAGCLFALAVYILIGSILSLRARAVAHPGVWGVVIACAAVLGMPPLWWIKRRAANVLQSEALREDGVGNLACGGMGLILLAGIAAQRVGAWWADPVAALLLGAIVAREGWESAWSKGDESVSPNPAANDGVQVRAFLGLGSNQGDRARMLARAADLLDGRGIRLAARSRVYESPPWGVTDQPWFLNQVLEVETVLSPSELLARCHEVEQALGRVRTMRWGPRTIDVDILLYGDLVTALPDLVIPHPELRRRAFVLVPLAELAPTLRLPTGEAVSALVAALPDGKAVRTE